MDKERNDPTRFKQRSAFGDSAELGALSFTCFSLDFQEGAHRRVYDRT